MKFGSKEYLKTLDNFIKGYDRLVDFKLFGYNFEMIFYIRPSDGHIDGDRANTMFIYTKKPKYQGCYLHD